MSVHVMEWVLEHSTVEHRGDLLVLIVLASHAHDDGRHAWPAVEKIAAKARLTRRGAQLALRRLEDAGAIERIGRQAKGVTDYRVVMDGEPEAKSVRGEVSSLHETPTGEASSPRSEFAGEVSDARGRSESHRGAKGSSPEPSVNRQEPSSSVELPLDGAAGAAQNGADTTSSQPSRSGETAAVAELFDYWRERCRHPQAKLTSDRRSKTTARLREGYSVEQMRAAIDGAATGAYVNEDGHRFDDLELIFRSGSKVEQFIARGATNGCAPPPRERDLARPWTEGA